jgi:hypothetical protein
MLSTLPKLADKAFVLGFFLPVLLAVLAILALFNDLPEVRSLLTATGEGDRLEKLFYFVLVVWCLSVLMLLINNAQYQILEGYRWPFSQITRFKNAEILRFEELSGRVNALRKERKDHHNKLPSDKELELQDHWIELRETFPSEYSLLLPTRFGNAIQAFEKYSDDVYGADSVTLWFHLATAIEKPLQSLLDDARAQVNCLVNLCLFSTFIGLIATIRLIWNFATSIKLSSPWLDLHHLFSTSSISFVGAIALATVVARLSYNLSIERIRTWGTLVRAAFDCSLPSLATKLGYRLPATGEAQRKFWNAVTQRTGFHIPLKPEDWIQAGAFEDKHGIGVEVEAPEKKENDTDDASEGEECSDNSTN